MVCDFYPIPVTQNSTNLGLPISIPEIILIIWITVLLIDEMREVSFLLFH